MSIVPRMANGDTQFKLIIPADLKKLLNEAADANRRSLSAEIVQRLQESFDREKRLADEYEQFSLRDISLAMIRSLDEYRGFQEMLQFKIDHGQLRPSIRDLQGLADNQRKAAQDLFSEETNPDGYTVKELAAKWKCSESLIRAHVKDGELQGSGRPLRISRASADAFIERRRSRLKESPAEIVERLRA